MADMEDREKAFENKYALDQEVMFRIEARTAKLFGLWIAEKLGMDEEAAKAYAGSVVVANLDEPGFDDVKRAVRPALAEKGIELTENQMDDQLEALLEKARVQIVEEGR